MKRAVGRAGYSVVRGARGVALPPDFDDADAAVWSRVAPFTMTSPERIFALRNAVKYVVRAGVEGAIVECGAWKGGSMMAVAETLLEVGARDRTLYLFDTFEGMSEPSDADVAYDGKRAAEIFESRDSPWAYAPLESVREAVLSIGYDPERIRFVKGRVEETIPGHAPDAISVLRLDTDWYESTRHELIHLFPRLARGGVLIIDDYGHWCGARRATDEYFEENGPPLLLNRIDYTGRIGVKM